MRRDVPLIRHFLACETVLRMKLHCVQSVVKAMQRKEFRVGATLHDAPMIEYNDLIGVYNGA